MALTATERSERAKEAAAARWSKEEHKLQQWHDMDLSDAMLKFAQLRVEMEEIGRIIAQRQPAEEEKVQNHCTLCEKPIKKAVYVETFKDPATGILMNAFICDVICHSKWMVKKMGGVIKS